MKCKNISTAGATPLQRAVWTLCGSMALLALTPAVSAPADTAAGQGMANLPALTDLVGAVKLAFHAVDRIGSDLRLLLRRQTDRGQREP